jgi:hypothetical protein
MTQIPKMTQILFECELLTDVILTQKSASTGNQTTLDFIPGSNFYGIVANQIYAENQADADKCFRLLHTGWIKFGDAHPIYNDIRALRTPAAYYHPKQMGLTECYIHRYVYDLIKSDEGKRNEFAQKQLKQCRTGFYAFSDMDGWHAVQTPTSFALKSAYDHNARRSADSQMFGYESLNKGLKMQFTLTYEESKIADEEIKEIEDLLIGTHRVGRSRSAQYGCVKIKALSKTSESVGKKNVSAEEPIVDIYADARLIFFDEFGVPTFTPTAQHFGFPDGYEIVWKKSQVRTFQYSPWNYKRQAYDTDRCGIEKGSVFVIARKEEQKNQSADFELSEYVGEYQLEGFGHILINPAFLKADSETGAVTYPLQKVTEQKVTLQSEQEAPIAIAEKDTPLVALLKERHNRDYYLERIYKAVEEYPDKDKWEGKEFAAQWGNIRKLATISSNVEDMENKLYKIAETSYLTHGVAKDKWEGHIQPLKKFVKKLRSEEKMPDSYIIMAMINLAAKMGKECGTNSKKGGNNE